MHRVLLSAAASIAAIMIASPASSQSLAAAGFSASSGSGRLQVLSGRPARNDSSGHHRHFHVGDGIGPGWGYYDGDYDANRSFAEDKWNDWWHDRPDRAFPRWMSRNQDCSRRWYSGDVLTC